MFFIHCCDFVEAFVGPFPTTEAAQAHIESVIVPRGDSSTNSIITAREFEEVSEGWLVETPEEDRCTCSECGRKMTAEECGDVLPPELVCNQCAGITE